MNFIPNFDINDFAISIETLVGKLCGVDFGSHKIGVALSDLQKSLVFPHKIYIRKNINYDVEDFVNLIKTEKVVGFVIGAVLKENGEVKNPRLFQLTSYFFENLFNHKDLVGRKIPHYFHDENFSSHNVNELLHNYKFNRNQIAKFEDKVVAANILNEVLEEIQGLRSQ